MKTKWTLGQCLKVKIMSRGDFVCSKINDGTTLFRPVIDPVKDTLSGTNTKL